MVIFLERKEITEQTKLNVFKVMYRLLFTYGYYGYMDLLRPRKKLDFIIKTLLWRHLRQMRDKVAVKHKWEAKKEI